MTTLTICVDTNQLLNHIAQHDHAVLFVQGAGGKDSNINNDGDNNSRRISFNDSEDVGQNSIAHTVASCRYMLAIDPVAHCTDLNQRPKTQNIHNYSNDTSLSREESFLSGWAGLIDYSQQYQQTLTASFAYYDIVLHFNPDQTTAILTSRYQLPQQRIEQYLDYLNTINRQPSINKPAFKRAWQAQWTLADYRHRFDQLQNYLKAGDCYQVNLTYPFVCHDDLTDQSPIPLLSTFDAPMSGFFKHSDRWVASVSPERFIKIVDGKLETHPIKGTTPRADDFEQDQKYREELIHSEKNQAENLMIVDLLRNDLSLSAKPNSVRVTNLFKVESHHNVHQMVSSIIAELRDNLTPTDAIIKAFPGGSITGAPKKRAMEIIQELESSDRGAYCGSMGYIDDSGCVDFNILIRTIEAKPTGAVCWGGGGVTIASTAEDEYEEILHKVGKIIDHPI